MSKKTLHCKMLIFSTTSTTPPSTTTKLEYHKCDSTRQKQLKNNWQPPRRKAIREGNRQPSASKKKREGERERERERDETTTNLSQISSLNNRKHRGPIQPPVFLSFFLLTANASLPVSRQDLSCHFERALFARCDFCRVAATLI